MDRKFCALKILRFLWFSFQKKAIFFYFWEPELFSSPHPPALTRYAALSHTNFKQTLILSISDHCRKKYRKSIEFFKPQLNAQKWESSARKFQVWVQTLFEWNFWAEIPQLWYFLEFGNFFCQKKRMEISEMKENLNFCLI